MDRKRAISDLNQEQFNSLAMDPTTTTTTISSIPPSTLNNFAMDDQKIDRPFELEENFKRRKIEEWKQRMGFTVPIIDSSLDPSLSSTSQSNSSSIPSSSSSSSSSFAFPTHASSTVTSSVTPIDLQAIKKQVEERKKLALEALKRAKSNDVNTINNNNNNSSSERTPTSSAASTTFTSSASLPTSSSFLKPTTTISSELKPNISSTPIPSFTSSSLTGGRILNESIIPTPASTKLELLKPSIPKDHAYFDPSIGVPMKQKRKTAFKFIHQGKFILKAQKLRAEAKLQALKQQVSESIKKSKVGVHLNFITEKTGKKDPPPLIEWWDLPLALGHTTYEELIHHFDTQPKLKFIQAYTTPPSSSSSSSSSLKQEKEQESTDSMEIDTETSSVPASNTIASSCSSSSSSSSVALITSFILHPVPLPPVGQVTVTPRPVMLTKKERQKLRRQRRLEEQKEKQDKIRLGLLPPDQPKVKIANLMRVLQNEAIQDPTKMEAQVRQQMEQRKKKHEQTNKERQLTKEQKRMKKLHQLEVDSQRGLHACIFKCRPSCFTTLNKAKIFYNVMQLGLTGIGIMYQEHHVVIVEGGEKGLRSFKKLMLRRIQWHVPLDEEQEQLLKKTKEGALLPTSSTSLVTSSIHASMSTEGGMNQDDDMDLDDDDDDENDEKEKDVDSTLPFNGKGAAQDMNALSRKEPSHLLSTSLLDDSTFSYFNPTSSAYCWLLWEGDIQERSFQGFKFKQCHIEKQVNEVFATSKVEQYWDLAKNWNVPSLL